MPLDQLWAGWRAAYLADVVEDAASLRPDEHGSLFERVLALSDDEGLVVHRGIRCAAIMNAYPYATGHLLVVPKRAVAELGDLADDELQELWVMVRDAVHAQRSALGCEGVNVGLNLGAAAGAGVPDHLHVHCVPRWRGDTNFMTATADLRVLPTPLRETCASLRQAWPTTG